jgi:CRISPR-associated protein Csd1
MMLQALHDLAMRENLLSDPDYEWKPVAWLVHVSKEGGLLGIQGTHTVLETEGKRKPRPVPKSFLVPRQPVRTSGARAFFLVDKAEYLLGIDPDEKRPKSKLEARFQLFRREVATCLEKTGDEGVQAVAFLLEDIASTKVEVKLPEECAANDLFGFVYAPDIELLVSSRPRVIEYWKELRKAEEDVKRERCLVTGKIEPPTDLHIQLKKLPGASTSGVPLVAFNAAAFESHGWKSNENAPVSRAAAEAYGTALNRLLHPAWPDPDQEGLSLPRQNIVLSSDTVVCYWAAAMKHEFVTAFSGLLQADIDQVPELYHSIWWGRPPAKIDSSAFYALTLTGIQGRAIVRDWFESTIDQVQANLSQHYADLDLVRNTPPPKERSLPPQIPLRPLLRSLAVHGEDKRLPAALATQVFHAALAHTPYPFGLLQRAIERTRAEITRDSWADLERRDARASLIKAVLNRRRRFNPDSATRYKEVKREMDPHNTNQGYLLGRLIAVIERIQEVALGEVNATVVDKFFNGASAAPLPVFTRLDKNSKHYLRKIRQTKPRKTLVFYERLIGDINWHFKPDEGGYPTTLSLEDQGLFIIGYHHMKSWLWMKKDARERWKVEHGIDTPVSPEDIDAEHE